MRTNTNTPQNPQTFLKTITIIYTALLLGQLLFGTVCYLISPNPAANLKFTGDLLFYIVPVVIISAMFLGAFLFKQQTSQLAYEHSLKDKMAAYQTALIIRYALAEGGSLLGIVAFLLSGNTYYLVLVGFNVIYFIWIRPSKSKIKDDLTLTYEDEIAMGS